MASVSEQPSSTDEALGMPDDALLAASKETVQTLRLLPSNLPLAVYSVYLIHSHSVNHVHPCSAIIDFNTYIYFRRSSTRQCRSVLDFTPVLVASTSTRQAEQLSPLRYRGTWHNIILHPIFPSVLFRIQHRRPFTLSTLLPIAHSVFAQHHDASDINYNRLFRRGAVYVVHLDRAPISTNARRHQEHIAIHARPHAGAHACR